MLFYIRLLFCFLLISIANNVFASSTWRCGSRLVSSGDNQFVVIQRCGNPDVKNLLGWKRKLVTDGWYNSFEDVPVEEWIYRVKDNLYYVLKFENGELNEVTSHFTQ